MKLNYDRNQTKNARLFVDKITRQHLEAEHEDLLGEYNQKHGAQKLRHMRDHVDQTIDENHAIQVLLLHFDVLVAFRVEFLVVAPLEPHFTLQVTIIVHEQEYVYDHIQHDEENVVQATIEDLQRVEKMALTRVQRVSAVHLVADFKGKIFARIPLVVYVILKYFEDTRQTTQQNRD